MAKQTKNDMNAFKESVISAIAITLSLFYV